jgi:hypothetical protein
VRAREKQRNPDPKRLLETQRELLQRIRLETGQVRRNTKVERRFRGAVEPQELDHEDHPIATGMSAPVVETAGGVYEGPGPGGPNELHRVPEAATRVDLLIGDAPSERTSAAKRL